MRREVDTDAAGRLRRNVLGHPRALGARPPPRALRRDRPPTKATSSRGWPRSTCWSGWPSRARWARRRGGCGSSRCRAPGRSHRPRGAAGEAALANAYGHEAGIAEYVIGAMLAWSRGFCRMDASLRRGAWESSRAWAPRRRRRWRSSPEDARHRRLRPHRAGGGAAGPGLRHGGPRDPPRRPRAAAARSSRFLGGPAALPEVLRAADYLAVTLALTPDARATPCRVSSR